MLPGKEGNGGTCASIPVLITAIGRRLSWPLFLSTARGHVFCRWDDRTGRHPFGPQRFNIEGSTLRGGKFLSDDDYERWLGPFPPGCVEQGIYLKSLTPREELAMFLASRGHCEFDTGKLADARKSYAWAYRLAPHDPHYESFFIHAQRTIELNLEERVLRDYYGNHARLPFGAHPPHEIRRMQFDMMRARPTAGAELTPRALQFASTVTKDIIPPSIAPLLPGGPASSMQTPQDPTTFHCLSAADLEADGSAAAQTELQRRRATAAQLAKALPPPKSLSMPRRIHLVPPDVSSLRKLNSQSKHLM